MNKKEIIIIITGIILFTGIAVIMFKRNKKNHIQTPIAQTNPQIVEEDIEYDAETELYYIKDAETGEIIIASQDKGELKIYMANPYYNPYPLESRPTSLEEYMILEEIEEDVDITEWF